ncbi:MAG: hypothetical protein OXH27_00105 [Gammaproteobacteria bacterium]|nr:hypothetical protein [Gammaproteobacteria bacterium]MCY3689520.1 hypothetical protein [Gammaproteobacteria bacterium]MDE0479599.1 hypothetical protein [Gammaproteobacteria bacterium]MDE0508619.1 hypothetical protein [Gammaproteobacteria bacterium]MXX06428.1 hypothetical protein [Gammaproteobacteria bacterium]
MPTDTVLLQTIVATCFAASLIPQAMWRRRTGEYVGFQSNLVLLYFVFLMSFVGGGVAANYDAWETLVRTVLMVAATFLIGWLVTFIAYWRRYRTRPRKGAPPVRS